MTPPSRLLLGAKPVPLPVLLQHAGDCLAEREPARPYGCYGNKYDLVLDAQGRVLRIEELYHPEGRSPELPGAARVRQRRPGPRLAVRLADASVASPLDLMSCRAWTTNEVTAGAGSCSPSGCPR